MSSKPFAPLNFRINSRNLSGRNALFIIHYNYAIFVTCTCGFLFLFKELSRKMLYIIIAHVPKWNVFLRRALFYEVHPDSFRCLSHWCFPSSWAFVVVFYSWREIRCFKGVIHFFINYKELQWLACMQVPCIIAVSIWTGKSHQLWFKSLRCWTAQLWNASSSALWTGQTDPSHKSPVAVSVLLPTEFVFSFLLIIVDLIFANAILCKYVNCNLLRFWDY